MKTRYSPLFFFRILLTAVVLAGCSLPSTPPAGVALIHPTDGVFLPFEPYVLEAEAVGGEFTYLNFIVNEVTLASVEVDPTSTWELASTTWTPPATGEYYLSVDGIGGPGGSNRYLSRASHVCVTRSVTTVTPGYTGTGCDPMPPTPAFTSLSGVPDPVYYDAPLGAPSCPTELYVSTEMNDRSHIAQVQLVYNIYAGADTTPVQTGVQDLERRDGGNYDGRISLLGLDLSGLHGGEGRLEMTVYAFDIGSVRVALSGPVTVSVQHCVLSAPSLEPTFTLLPTIPFIPSSTHVPTDQPTDPPPTNTLAPCNSYLDQLKCESAGYCKWNGSSCY